MIAVVRNVLVHFRSDVPRLDGTVSESRRDEVDSRRVERMLAGILRLDPSPLSTLRPVTHRLLATCRDFSVLLCAMMRHKGIPARVRYGFTHLYYQPKLPLHDHVLTEYWNGDAWSLAECRLHACPVPPHGIWQGNIPPTLFLSGAQAWRSIRSGDRDARMFSGLRYDRDMGWRNVRKLLMFDAAALSGNEPLLWDRWDGRPVDEFGRTKYGARQQSRFLDELASFDPAVAADCARLIEAFASRMDRLAAPASRPFIATRAARGAGVHLSRR
ncbi:transglutaminase-like domain-containing protein [Thiomonas sp.]|uniref:transglutaminase-like domain-containing protein n=1 Tax=Thiomonas sp. TaxID=2047785 RepID=UPI002617C9F3|nr:transglutaminase-like domain-containing protein [Thiomonas sp.]